MRNLLPGTIAVLSLAIAPLASAQCSSGSNIVGNCDFTSNINGWASGQTQVWDGGVGHTAAGSLLGDAIFDTTRYAFSTSAACISSGVVGGSTYGVGVFAQTNSSTNVQCQVQIEEYSDGACTTPILAIGTLLTPISNSSWTEVSGNLGLLGTTNSIYYRVVCEDATASPATFSIHLDDAWAGIGLLSVELSSFEVE